jgi:hypothetical protein
MTQPTYHLNEDTKLSKVIDHLSKDFNYSFTQSDIIVLADYPDWVIGLQVCTNAICIKNTISNYHIRHKTMCAFKMVEHLSSVTNIKQDEIKRIQPDDLYDLYMFIRMKQIFTLFEGDDLNDCIVKVHRALESADVPIPVKIKSIKLSVPKSKFVAFENNMPVGAWHDLNISNRDDGQILNVKIKNITVEQLQTLLVAIA